MSLAISPCGEVTSERVPVKLLPAAQHSPTKETLKTFSGERQHGITRTSPRTWRVTNPFQHAKNLVFSSRCQVSLCTSNFRKKVLKKGLPPDGKTVRAPASAMLLIVGDFTVLMYILFRNEPPKV
eukprot:1180181-Prorocentrum_minimum.AAC.6